MAGNPMRIFFNTNNKLYQCCYTVPIDTEYSFTDNQLTLHFFDNFEPEKHYEKAIIEIWTGPDVIFKKESLGSWSKFDDIILENLEFIDKKDNNITFKIEKSNYLDNYEEIQLLVPALDKRPLLTSETIMMMRKKKQKYIKLDNYWRINLENDYKDNYGKLYSIDVSIEQLNGDKWDLQINGQVKTDGCADWGFNKPVMLHFCGKRDAGVIQLTYDIAMKHIQDQLKL